ncbi:glycoside hydrolase family 55 protein [Atractiella rhizophila]|nr:glycoside hydrolase family 55 protein [Atractiella rhizophila]
MITSCTLFFLQLSFLLRSASSQLGARCNGRGLQVSDPTVYWLEGIQHQGLAPYAEAGYTVWRNVKEFGAMGDGVTDDTTAINNAIFSGGRCGDGCPSTSTTPAVVYFPPGTYRVSSPIRQAYLTQFIGSPIHVPTIAPSTDFVWNATNTAVVDVDPYRADGSQWYTPQNQFFRAIQNLHIDISSVPESTPARALHWQVSQATHLQNIEITMAEGRQNQVGVYMESGSGGFLSDVRITGGGTGMVLGNQQFTIRNVSISNAITGIEQLWDWSFTYIGLSINNCQTGVHAHTGSTLAIQTTQHLFFLDTLVQQTPTFLQTNASDIGSIVIKHLTHNGVQNIVRSPDSVQLAASTGSAEVDLFVAGPTSVEGTANGSVQNEDFPDVLMNNANVFGREMPTYQGYAVTDILSVRSAGAKGDGSSDDLAVLQQTLDDYAGCRIIYFDAGIYRISDTLTIPPSSIIVGEAYPTIQAFGSNFADSTLPRVGVRVGADADHGSVEISGMLFNAAGGSKGAIILEWNLHEDTQGSAAMWNSHLRLGGTRDSSLTLEDCPTTSRDDRCWVAYLGLHLTKKSAAYLENVWIWTSDHDIDAQEQDQINVFSARGMLVESQGPLWLYGTASEHHGLYQYLFDGAQNVFTSLIQTETPYYQPTPSTNFFASSSSLFDPSTYPSNNGSAWAIYVRNSKDVTIAGAGLYSFFSSYTQTCIASFSCQGEIVNVEGSKDIRIIGLATIGSGSMINEGGESLAQASQHRTGFASLLSVFDCQDSDSVEGEGGHGTNGSGSAAGSLLIPQFETWMAWLAVVMFCSLPLIDPFTR